MIHRLQRFDRINVSAHILFSRSQASGPMPRTTRKRQLTMSTIASTLKQPILPLPLPIAIPCHPSSKAHLVRCAGLHGDDRYAARSRSTVLGAVSLEGHLYDGCVAVVGRPGRWGLLFMLLIMLVLLILDGDVTARGRVRQGGLLGLVVIAGHDGYSRNVWAQMFKCSSAQVPRNTGR
jgi:hypothetical protein